jgi:hypothetical protein
MCEAQGQARLLLVALGPLSSLGAWQFMQGAAHGEGGAKEHLMSCCPKVFPLGGDFLLWLVVVFLFV